MALGRHVTLDAFAGREHWPDNEGLLDLLMMAALTSGATPLESRVIQLPCAKSRPGSPPGGTAWVGLDESHITLHWYTQKHRVLFALDAFTCGAVADPLKIINIFKTAIHAEGETTYYERFGLVQGD